MNMKRAFLWMALATSLIASVAYAAVIRTDDNVGTSGAAYQVGPIIDQAQAATVTSDVIEMKVLSGISVQVDHGNVVGTLALQSSNDNVTYYAVQGGSFAAISGSGGEVVEIGSLRSRYYRFVYTHSSGTGLLKVTPYVKGK